MQVLGRSSNPRSTRKPIATILKRVRMVRMMMFQSSIDPKADRYENCRTARHLLDVPILDRPESRSLLHNPARLYVWAVVPILDRPESRSLLHDLIKIVIIEFVPILDRPESRSLPNSLAICLSCSWFQSSIDPKADRYGIHFKPIHSKCFNNT